MAALSYIYTDAALTEAFDDAAPLTLSAPDGSTAVARLYIGVPDVARKLQATSDPGVDAITLSITDSDAVNGVEAADIKLATTEAGLASAVGGDSLSLGTEIVGGAANRVDIWVQWSSNDGAGTFTDIALQLSAVSELDV